MVNNKRTKNWTLIVLIICIIVNLIDLVTAKRILIGEGNPIYIFTKSYLSLIGMKLLTIALLILIYVGLKKAKSESIKFISVMILVYAMFGSGLGAYSNLSATQEEVELVEQRIQELEEQGNYEVIEEFDRQKARTYMINAILVLALPMLMSYFSFLLYQNSNKYFEGRE